MTKRRELKKFANKKQKRQLKTGIWGKLSPSKFKSVLLLAFHAVSSAVYLGWNNLCAPGLEGLFVLISALTLALTVGTSVRASVFQWNGAGISGGAASTNLNVRTNWTPNSTLTIADIASISLNASGGNLIQTGSLTYDTLFFTTRSGTNRGTITLNQDNYFGTFTGYVRNTLVLASGSTTVGNNFTLGDGTNGFHLLLNGGTLAVGGVLTNANGGYFANSNSSGTAIATFRGNIIQNSGATLQNGRGLSNRLLKKSHEFLNCSHRVWSMKVCEAKPIPNRNSVC
jgi:hypothetical protein